MTWYLFHLVGLLAPSVNLVKIPVTNLTDQKDCGFTENIEDYVDGSECDLSYQPCYYTVNVTKVYKGNFTVC